MRKTAELALALLAAAVLTACADDGSNNTAFETGGPENGPPELVHVHGLGVNPANNMLYVATHNGLYRLNEGVPELVGGRYWDVMGFTVRGPDNFIGGGHPSLNEIREGRYPPLLGFIETNDGGASWEILAMRGEADLHAFAVDGDAIYAVDSTSGRVLASSDGRSWEARSGVRALSLAAKEDGRILATTEVGLLESTDGARTWTAPAGAPPVLLVASQPGTVTWGVSSDGGVFRDGGEAGWQRVGSVAGRPEAFGASADRLFAATGEGIFESSDGVSWIEVYANPE
ncbi:exo-alpha-sialidase [bacterium]|nr:exo-alpha-sialidase [bacterium]